MGWTPPITIVPQMSPSQLDELSQQIGQPFDPQKICGSIRHRPVCQFDLLEY
jgi:hypothetical protein